MRPLPAVRAAGVGPGEAAAEPAEFVEPAEPDGPELWAGRRWPAALLGLFGLALALRGGYVVELADLATFRAPVMDAGRYDEWAREILAGAWLPARPFDQAPLYPYFLALVYAVFGPVTQAVRWIQVVLGAGTVVLLASGTGRAFGRGAGVVTGLLAALSGSLVFYSGVLLKPTLTLFFLALLWWLTAGESWSRRRALAAGVCLGCAGLLREPLVLLAPLWIGWWWLRCRRPGCLAGRPRNRSRFQSRPPVEAPRASAPGRAVTGILLMVGGVLLPLLPVTWANYRAGGGWVPVSANGGVNFYIGNSAHADGTFRPLSDRSQDPQTVIYDSRILAARLESERTGQAITVEEMPRALSSKILFRESFRWLGDHPAAAARLWLRKAWLFWADYEIPDAEGWVVHRRLSAVLALAPVGFGAVAALGLVGMWPAWRRNRWATVLAALGIVGSFVGVWAFFVFGRYRLPVLVFLLPPAGVAVDRLVAEVRGAIGGGGGGSGRKRFAAGVTAVAVLWGLSAVPPFSPETRDRHEATLWMNLGVAANGLAAEGLADLRRSAVEGRGEEAVARWEEGFGRTGEAVSYLSRTLDLDPSFFTAGAELGVALYRRSLYLSAVGREAEAARHRGAAESALRRVLALPRERLPEGLQEQVRDLLREVTAADRRSLVSAPSSAEASADRGPRSSPR